MAFSTPVRCGKILLTFARLPEKPGHLANFFSLSLVFSRKLIYYLTTGAICYSNIFRATPCHFNWNWHHQRLETEDQSYIRLRNRQIAFFCDSQILNSIDVEGN